MTSPQDICASKHGGAETSKDAFERIRPNLLECQKKVHEAVVNAGDFGLTLNEFCDQSGTQKNSASPRFTELSGKGLIYKFGRRGGCAVWRAVM